jgi:holliday junction DNA helicase RuvB
VRNNNHSSEDPGADVDQVLDPEHQQSVSRPPRTLTKTKQGGGGAAPVASEEERQLDYSLRPHSLTEFIGQQRIKQVLGMSIEAARKRGEPLDHTLFSAPPGLGKTSLAHIIARELGVNLRVTSGPAIERAGDLAAIVSDLNQGDVLFIDEIHRLARIVEEILYPAMEDFELNIVVGKGPGARSMKLAVKPFTMVGATTRSGLLSSPLRDRFGQHYHLDFYGHDDLTQIIQRSAQPLDVSIDHAGAVELAARARGTPRIANRLLRGCVTLLRSMQPLW